MKLWPATVACASRAHCAACRLRPEFRASIVAKYPQWDGTCPHGVTLANLPLATARTVSYPMKDGKRCRACPPIPSQ